MKYIIDCDPTENCSDILNTIIKYRCDVLAVFVPYDTVTSNSVIRTCIQYSIPYYYGSNPTHLKGIGLPANTQKLHDLVYSPTLPTTHPVHILHKLIIEDRRPICMIYTDSVYNVLLYRYVYRNSVYDIFLSIHRSVFLGPKLQSNDPATPRSRFLKELVDTVDYMLSP